MGDRGAVQSGILPKGRGGEGSEAPLVVAAICQPTDPTVTPAGCPAGDAVPVWSQAVAGDAHALRVGVRVPPVLRHCGNVNQLHKVGTVVGMVMAVGGPGGGRGGGRGAPGGGRGTAGIFLVWACVKCSSMEWAPHVGQEVQRRLLLGVCVCNGPRLSSKRAASSRPQQLAAGGLHQDASQAAH